MEQSPPLAAYVLLAAVVLLFIAIPLVVLVQYKRAIPRLNIAGFHVRYLPGADENWPHLTFALEALRTLARARFPAHADKLLRDVWVEVYPTDTADLQMCDGKGCRHLSGSKSTWSYLLGFKSGPLLKVRQLRQYVPKQTGEFPKGAILPADQSALFHQVQQYLWI